MNQTSIVPYCFSYVGLVNKLCSGAATAFVSSINYSFGTVWVSLCSISLFVKNADLLISHENRRQFVAIFR